MHCPRLSTKPSERTWCVRPATRLSTDLIKRNPKNIKIRHAIMRQNTCNVVVFILFLYIEINYKMFKRTLLKKPEFLNTYLTTFNKYLSKLSEFLFFLHVSHYYLSIKRVSIFVWLFISMDKICWMVLTWVFWKIITIMS